MVQILMFYGVMAIAVADTPSTPPEEVLQAYRVARDALPRSAEAHVKLALWCEANGMMAERAQHLAMAVAIAPDHAPARGLIGQVRHDGAWRSPEAVARRVTSDAEVAEQSRRYHEQRAAAPSTSQGQWELALWCEREGLAQEAAAHFATVTKMGPGRPVDHRADAWKRLGYRQIDGQWMTEDQIAVRNRDRDEQRLATREWLPRLAELRKRIGRDDDRENALSDLASVTHPRAVPAVLSVFAKGSPADQAIAVQLLGQIDAPSATRALAVLAIQGKSPSVCRAAAETLTHRDPRDFVAGLIDLVSPRVKYAIEPADHPDTLAVLRVEGETFIENRVYQAPARFTPGSNFHGMMGVDDNGVPFAVSGRTLRSAGGNLNHPDVRNEIQKNRERLAQANRDSQHLAQTRLQNDLAFLASYNSKAQASNDNRVLPVLNAVTGEDFGDDKEAWKRWWVDRQGYRYVSPSRPVITNTRIITEGVSIPITSCFGAGTPVLTINGMRPIETLSVGDRVLSRDSKTGALAYQAIEAVHHNPPDATLKITAGADAIIATGYHRFWKVGQGWVMARDLKPGDTLRTRDGSVQVARIEPAGTQPVYNLDVARTRSFFVGASAQYVHDNTPPEPELEPFDAIAVK